MPNDFKSFVASRVVDADTIRDEQGTSHRVLGIDAPESGTPAGEEATEFAKYVVAKHGLEAKESGQQGYYGRDLTELKLKNRETGFGAHLIRMGYARRTQGSEFDAENANAEVGANTANVLGLQDRRTSNNYKFDHSDRRVTDYSGKDGTFGNAIDRGVDQTQGLLYSAANVVGSALGDVIGTELLDEWGVEGIERNAVEAALNPAEVQSWDDVDSLADFGTYVIEAIGEQAINIALLAGTGGLGNLAKGGATVAVRAAIGKKFQQIALKQGNKLNLAQQLNRSAQMSAVGTTGLKGSTMGVAAGSYALGVGEIGSELREAGIDSPVTALVGGVPFAALDTIGFQQTIGRLFKGIDKGIATQSIKDIGKNIFRAAGLGAAAESSTEMLQEVITLSSRAYHDPTFEILSEENIHRIREAGIKAGIVGAVGGGAATGLNNVYGKLTAPKERDVLVDELARIQAAAEQAEAERQGPPPPPGGAGGGVSPTAPINPDGSMTEITGEGGVTGRIMPDPRDAVAEEAPLPEEFAPTAGPVPTVDTPAPTVDTPAPTVQEPAPTPVPTVQEPAPTPVVEEPPLPEEFAPTAGPVPVEEEFTPTTFPKRDSDYEYMIQENGVPLEVPAELVAEGTPAGAKVSVRDILTAEIEPQMKQTETQITAYEALRKCLAS